MVDVLVAIVILGVASVAIFMVVSAGQAALVHSSQRAWATMVGVQAVAEIDLGLEKRRQGSASLPAARTVYRWELQDKLPKQGGDDGVSGPAVGVSWNGPRQSHQIVVPGFVDPKSW